LDSPNSDVIIIDAADFFYMEAANIKEYTDTDMFAEHALDEQRFFYAICLAYGAIDSEETKEVMLDLKIDEQQLHMCIDTFEKREVAWNKLLLPYKKQSL